MQVSFIKDKESQEPIDVEMYNLRETNSMVTNKHEWTEEKNKHEWIEKTNMNELKKKQTWMNELKTKQTWTKTKQTNTNMNELTNKQKQTQIGRRIYVIGKYLCWKKNSSIISKLRIIT